MRNLSNKGSLVMAGLLVFASCNDFLEENPDNRVELNNLEKASQLLTNAYASGGYTFTEWMSDNVDYTTGTFRLTEHNQSYAWQDVIGVNQDTPTNFWETTYDAIAHANEVLAVIDELPGDDAYRDAVKAEALLTRAYGHFMLVNLFAPHYDKGTAKSDPGIPYVDEPETVFIKKYTRNTVLEVYDKIEDDLLDGLDLVDGSFYNNSGKYHFTPNAALAFASRFFLFRGDFEECIKYSTQLLGSDPGVFIKDVEALLAETANAEEYIQEYTSPGDESNLLLIRQITNYPVNVGYWPAPNTVNRLYNINPWGAEDIRTSIGIPIFLRGNNWAIAKYQFLFERSSLTSNVGLNYTIMPAFRGEEVLLNRAEAHLFNNKVSSALADLQILVNLRYEGDPVISVNVLQDAYGESNAQLATLFFIVDERRKEFIHEGLRWFDIRRFGIEVQHFLENGTMVTLESDDPRKILQIPQAAIDVGGLEPNPR
jgi:starch-binding outer membrane protein, SusD/RagB family